MMHGIDVSSWQGDIHPEALPIDFCIAKATEGTTYVNPYCDPVIQRCIDAEMPWGFYHFARDNGRMEAEFFISACENYFHHGIPVLDFEVSTSDDIAYCETFMQIVHDETDIWPMIYISASLCPKFKWSWIPEECGLWVAGYPYAYSDWTNDQMPYDISPWEFAAIWQFTSSLQLSGYNNSYILDGNIAYMDKTAWTKYANSEDIKQNQPEQPRKKTYHELAREIMLGEYGTGNDRKRMIESQGYDYRQAQDMVNRYYDRAHECIKGTWGNGWNRKNALESLGYDYDTVQMIVNALMKG